MLDLRLSEQWPYRVVRQKFASGTFCLHIQGRKIREATSQQGAGSNKSSLGSSDRSVDFYQSARDQEQGHCHGNLNLKTVILRRICGSHSGGHKQYLTMHFILKMEPVCCIETYMTFYGTTPRHSTTRWTFTARVTRSSSWRALQTKS
jgi:hypothetical protein